MAGTLKPNHHRTHPDHPANATVHPLDGAWIYKQTP